MAASQDIQLPDNLEEIALKQFDKLVEDGSIFYETSQPETVEHNGFQVRPITKSYASALSNIVLSSSSEFCHTSTRSQSLDQTRQAGRNLEARSSTHERKRSSLSLEALTA